MILQTILLVIAVCIDAFVASFAYGTNKIKIPLVSAVVISTIGSIFLWFALSMASFVQQFIPAVICAWLSFVILFSLGVSGIFESSIKSLLRKKQNNSHIVNFKAWGIEFMVNVYLDQTKADVDNSKTLSPKEAFLLAVTLSLDSLVTGFGGGFIVGQTLWVIGLTFGCGLLAVFGGSFIGRHIAYAKNLNITPLGGIILIILAVLRVA